MDGEIEQYRKALERIASCGGCVFCSEIAREALYTVPRDNMDEAELCRRTMYLACRAMNDALKENIGR